MSFSNNDDLNEQLKHNPETAMDLIEEFLKKQGVDLRNQAGPITSHAVTDDDGDQLYYVTLTSIRSDNHILRANNPEEALQKAVKRTEADEEHKFTRRYETLNPVVFQIPRIGEGESLDNLMMGEVPVGTQVKTTTEALNFQDRVARKPRTTKHQDKQINEIAEFLSKQAEELD